MQRFFTNTIQSKFIKNLLCNVALPIINTVKDGDYVIAGTDYMYNNSYVRCITSGLIGSTAQITIVQTNIELGKTYPKYTSLFKSKSAFYDTETHEALGHYLRCYRDIFGTDLMPFYNCFSGRYTSKFYIAPNSASDPTLGVHQLGYDYYTQTMNDYTTLGAKKVEYKIMMVPVKFNKTYTVAVDCPSSVYIAPCFISHSQLASVNYGGVRVNLTSVYNTLANHIESIPMASFKQPQTIRYENNSKQLLIDYYAPEGILFDDKNYISKRLTFEQFFQRYESELYMLIQVPENIDSSVVVLEGDYTHTTTTKYFDINSIPEFTEDDFDYYCSSKLSLLNINDNIRYPFANRLIEYLLWNVIDNNDEIAYNVLGVQSLLDVLDNEGVVKGHYDDALRAQVYMNYRDSKKTLKFDNNGYVDKDVEAYLFK